MAFAQNSTKHRGLRIKHRMSTSQVCNLKSLSAVNHVIFSLGNTEKVKFIFCAMKKLDADKTITCQRWMQFCRVCLQKFL